MHLIDQLSGEGDLLHAGGSLMRADVHYELAIYQTMTDIGGVGASLACSTSIRRST